jgi:hypothetical protein
MTHSDTETEKSVLEESVEESYEIGNKENVPNYRTIRNIRKNKVKETEANKMDEMMDLKLENLRLENQLLKNKIILSDLKIQQAQNNGEL